MDKNMISVILATRNGEKYIERSIESVLNQTEKNFELIIINDTSEDNTLDIIKRYSNTDKRVNFINLEKNIGPGLARHQGILQSRGEYIAIIDDDDYWISKDKLKIQKEFLEKNKDYVLVGSTKTKIVDENNNFIKYYKNPSLDKSIRRTILIKNNFMNCTVMFRKDAYMKVGGFQESFLAEDYDLWLRLGLIGKFCNLDNIEVAYTVRKNSLSRNKIKLYRKNIEIIKKYYKKYPFGYIGIIKSYIRIIILNTKNIF
jgi:glycosyltransferase involved in cell wall biosynthesis